MVSWWQGLGDGKSVLATQNIVEGIGQGDPGIVVVFEERLQAVFDGPHHARDSRRGPEDWREAPGD